MKFPATANPPPTSDDDWCNEALTSDASFPLAGVIANSDVANRFLFNLKVSSLASLENKPWWNTRSPSLRLRRNLAEYSAALRLLLHHANSIMFIDTQLNPAQNAYQEFTTLLQGAAHRSPAPTLEIHRVIYEGVGRDLPGHRCLEEDFRSAMTTSLRAAGLVVKVFIWDDFHDRHIVSDLGGFILGNGLKTTTSNATTAWTRLGRDVRDNIQREFDVNSSEHHLHHSFTLP